MKAADHPKQNKLLSELKSLFFLLGIVFILRWCVFGIYVVPTGSMLPTIKLQDRILGNHLSYGLFLPFGYTQVLSWSTPNRGEIILFEAPHERVTYVKRVVGVAGDEITFVDGILSINGEVVQEELLEDRSILRDMGESDEDKNLFLEQWPDGKTHHILRRKFGSATEMSRQVFRVPEDHVMVVGDNRDGSLDSRSAVMGFVNNKRIYGRAHRVLISTAPSDSWLPNVRWDRIFAKLD